ncbi:MAG: hypothetical protein CVU40_17015 [Chloroflexi bacterium HGW-Chloroflexi-2]|nr:MAG: hypothetical protein CVU40_17015 [Chloroflexi bacterium HGW-Chloroflexi-2]
MNVSSPVFWHTNPQMVSSNCRLTFPLIEKDPCPFATLAMLKALSAIEDLRESKVGILGRRKYSPAG